MATQSGADVEESFRSYDILSKFYRQLAISRDHFGRQLSVLETIAEMEGLPTSARILDAACGTGDVACLLFEKGYRRIEAIDGSLAMLSQVETTSEAAQIGFEHVSWAALSEYLCKKEPYDIIYLMGNSLAHVSSGALPSIFDAIWSGLNKGGLLLFDLRPWESNQEGLLREPGRLAGVFRSLGKFLIHNQEYWADEWVEYDDRKQTVRYRLRPAAGRISGLPIETAISYHLFDHSEAKDNLIAGGFRPGSIEVCSFSCWNYLVVIARK